MLKFSIAFLVPDNKNSLKHCIIESATEDDALRIFFKNELCDFYSDDERGFSYFKQDFLDPDSKSGSVIILN
jgi:hypothetical protein